MDSDNDSCDAMDSSSDSMTERAMSLAGLSVAVTLNGALAAYGTVLETCGWHGTYRGGGSGT